MEVVRCILSLSLPAFAVRQSGIYLLPPPQQCWQEGTIRADGMVRLRIARHASVSSDCIACMHASTQALMLRVAGGGSQITPMCWLAHTSSSDLDADSRQSLSAAGCWSTPISHPSQSVRVAGMGLVRLSPMLAPSFAVPICAVEMLRSAGLLQMAARLEPMMSTQPA